MNNIVLIGFMGCGKTSVGVRLSYCLKKTMVDTDKEIERQRKLTIAGIFDQYGEQAFREMETECLKRLLLKKQDGIISVGGGLPVKHENRQLLKKLGTVFYLRVSAPTVCKRLADDNTRPLLQGEEPEKKVYELLKKRAPVYEAAADVIIDVDNKSLDEIVDEIIINLEGKHKNEAACD